MLNMSNSFVEDVRGMPSVKELKIGVNPWTPHHRVEMSAQSLIRSVEQVTNPGTTEENNICEEITNETINN